MKVRYMKKSDAIRCNLSQFPNFHASGSIRGMKEKYYGKDALLVRSGDYIYNVPAEIYYQAH
jgi:hypothetical protein